MEERVGLLPISKKSRRVVCAVLFRLFGTVGLFNELQMQKKEVILLG